MSDHDAYEDEMRLRRPFDTDDPEFSSLAEEIRFACRGAPGQDVEARHIAAMLEQARVTPDAPLATGQRRARRRVGVLARLGAAAAGLALLTGGLAVAGADLPGLPRLPGGGPASDEASASDRQTGDVEEDIGGGGRSETALRVQEAIEMNLPSLQAGDISGCEFGAMVSAAARVTEPDTSRCAGAGETKLEAEGSKVPVSRGRARESGDGTGPGNGSAGAKGKKTTGGPPDSAGNSGGPPGSAAEDKSGKPPAKSQGNGPPAGKDDGPGPSDAKGGPPDGIPGGKSSGD